MRSVPSGCLKLGAARDPKFIIADWSFGSKGASSGQARATSTTRLTRASPSMPVVLRLKRCQPWRHMPGGRAASTPISIGAGAAVPSLWLKSIVLLQPNPGIDQDVGDVGQE